MKQTLRNAYIAFMKKSNPNWVVSKKTLKTNPAASLWVLDSSEEEISAIKKLKFSENELKARMWSLTTRLALLNSNNFALVDDISTADEQKIVLNKAKNYFRNASATTVNNLSVDILVKALRRRTPSAEALKELIANLEEPQIMVIAQKFPQAFYDLKPFEIMGLKSENEKGTLVWENKRFQLAKALVDKNPKQATAYMDIIHANKAFMKDEDVTSFYTYMFDVALKNNLDMSFLIWEMYQDYPELYATLRMNMGQNPYIGECFLQMFRLIKSYFNASTYSDTMWNKDSQKKSDDIEALYWYQIATSNLNNTQVMRIMIGQLEFFKEKLTNTRFNFLIKSMISCFHVAGQASILMKYTTDTQNTTAINKRLLTVATPSDLLLRYPFKEDEGWNVWQQKKAINTLIDQNMFPVNRISELPKELQDFSKLAMLSRAQIMTLKRSKETEWQKLFNQGPLTSDAQKVMLSSSSYLSNLKLWYIEQYGLSEQAFIYLLNMEPATREHGVAYLEAYNRKKGLSEKEILMLLQSQYADLVPSLLNS